MWEIHKLRGNIETNARNDTIYKLKVNNSVFWWV